jgi:hypothetical protein
MVAGEAHYYPYIYNYIQYSFERAAEVRTRVVEVERSEGVGWEVIGLIGVWKCVERSLRLNSDCGIVPTREGMTIRDGHVCTDVHTMEL